eukprot:4006781-Amphidinium_carterae.1
MTSELSMTLPLANGGVVAWVQRGLGRKAADLATLNMVTYQLIDLATYPTLMAQYEGLLPAEAAWWLSNAMVVFAILLAFLLNLSGLEVSADVFTATMVLIMLPFMVGFVIAIPKWQTALDIAIGTIPATTTGHHSGWGDVYLFLSTMMWLNTGWDSIGNLAEEVCSPKDFVWGMLMAALMCPIFYCLCSFAAFAGGPGPWDEGFLAVAYGRLWAPLRPWIVCCAVAGNFLLYTSELACLACLVQALSVQTSAEQVVPQWMGRHFVNRARVLAGLSLIEIALVLTLNFEYLVQLSTLLHTVAFWLTLSAFTSLRFGTSRFHRLWSIPCGSVGACLILVVKVPVLTLLVVSACSSWSVVLGAFICNLLFVTLPYALRRWEVYASI